MKKICSLPIRLSVTLLLICSSLSLQAMQNNRTALHKAREKNARNLIDAAHEGDMIRVKRLTESENADVNACVHFITTAFKTTPLAQAAQQGHLELVQFLVQNNAQVNQTRTDGTSPLFLTAENGHSPVAEFLLKNNANPNQSDLKFTTPLHQASDEHHATVNLLLKFKANPNQPDAIGATSLMFACQAGQFSIAALLLGAKALVDSQTHDEHGFTALTQAAEFGHNGVVTLLVETDAQVDKPRRRDKKTPLHLATEKNHLTVVSTLLKHGADQNWLDSTSKKAIDYAKTDDMKKLFSGDEIKKED